MRLNKLLEAGKRGPKPLKDTKLVVHHFYDATPTERGEPAKLRFSKRTYQPKEVDYHADRQSKTYDIWATIPADILQEIQTLIITNPESAFSVESGGGIWINRGIAHRMLEEQMSADSKRKLDEVIKRAIEKEAPQFWNEEAHSERVEAYGYGGVPTEAALRKNAFDAIMEKYKNRWRNMVRSHFTGGVDRRKLYSQLKWLIDNKERTATAKQLQNAIDALKASDEAK